MDLSGINSNNINAEALLDRYKRIYFDGKYYFTQKAAAYNAKGFNGRTNWTAEDFFDIYEMQDRVENAKDGFNWAGEPRYTDDSNGQKWTTEDFINLDAWNDFISEGYKYKHVDNTYGINPSPYFDVKRYYKELEIDTYTETDPITHYTESIAKLYDGGDPAAIAMPVTPKRVGLGKIVIDSRKLSSDQIPKSDDNFTNGLQHSISYSTNWNYIRLNQNNTLYY